METNLHKFQAFTSAAYHSSFTVAAEELGCTQSSISRMVASLEKEWDVRLFNRHGGYVSLTPEGKTLLPVAEEVCQAYSKLSNQVNRVSAIEMGNLVIAAPSSFLSRALPGFIVVIETAPLLQKQLKNARMTFASSDSFTIMSMVESGLGVSLLPLEATKGTNFDIDVHHLETPVHRNVFITHRVKGEMSRTTEEFLKYLS